MGAKLDIVDLSASDLARAIAARTLAPSEVMAASLAHIAQVNPTLNAIVALRDPDDLMAEARALDDAPHQGWLHGMPLAVKDLVATKGLCTTWGSPLHATHIPEADDLIAARMRAAGAIFIGKTNVPEWGQGSHTFNPVYGPTRNPYDPTRTPGGSSGGAACALAARMVPVADGSDMMGSLRNPAAFCNVYGFRPTWGLVPSDAIGDTFLATLATEGPMARTVEDVANLLTIQSGPNPQAPFGRDTRDFAADLNLDPRGKRIGWLSDWSGAYPVEPGILDLCHSALHQFEGMGCHIDPLPAPFPAADLWQAWVTLRAMLTAGSKRSLYDDPTSRALTKPETLWEIEQGLTLSAAAVYTASTIRSHWYATAARLFETYDYLIMPSAQVWPFDINLRWPTHINATPMDTYHRWMEIVVPVSLIGLPALNIPIGFGPQGLPMGMQIIGRTGADTAVLALGQSWHLATDWPHRRPPPALAPLPPQG